MSREEVWRKRRTEAGGQEDGEGASVPFLGASMVLGFNTKTACLCVKERV